MFIQQLTGEGPLGAFVAQYLVGVRRQQFPPLFVGVGDFEARRRRSAKGPQPSAESQHCNGGGAGEESLAAVSIIILLKLRGLIRQVAPTVTCEPVTAEAIFGEVA